MSLKLLNKNEVQQVAGGFLQNASGCRFYTERTDIPDDHFEKIESLMQQEMDKKITKLVIVRKK